jgi:predicted  nucleic acid-binding Zn-ribbon protein
MQQAAFGGAAFFKQTFGFSEGGSSFASGGIVGKHAKAPSHHRPHIGSRKVPRFGANRVLAGIMSRLNAMEDDKSFLDQDYGDLSSRYSVMDGNQSFVNSDGTVNTAFVTQRTEELQSLLTEREKLIAVMDDEQGELAKGIRVLKALIARMVKQLKAEKKRVEQDAKAIARLTAQIAQEQKKKKPNQGQITSWRNQITRTRSDQSSAKHNISQLTTGINDHRSTLATWDHDARFLPLDEYGIKTDIIDLRQQLGTLGSPAAVIAAYGGGGGGGAGTGGADVAALLAEIGQLNLALSLQGAQSALIGSFAKGTLSVPETGLALVHAGEQIVPAGQTKGGQAGGPWSGDVNITLSGPLEPLAHFITATVDTPQVADRISVQIGRKANQRMRSLRHG